VADRKLSTGPEGQFNAGRHGDSSLPRGVARVSLGRIADEPAFQGPPHLGPQGDRNNLTHGWVPLIWFMGLDVNFLLQLFLGGPRSFQPQADRGGT